MSILKIVLAGLVALPLIGSGTSQAERIHQPVYTQGPKAWALATTALLTYHNGDRVDMLAPNARNETNVAETRVLLRDWWGINTRADLFHSLQFLEGGGHRADFQKMGQALVAMNDAQYRAALSSQKSHPERVRVMKLTREHFRASRANSLVAWDYGRYIMLCRWGYMVGFLTEDEAWARIMPAARRIQSSFQSWPEFGTDYLVGREFWSTDEMDRSGKIYRDIEKWLHTAPRSPWKLLPWRTDLGS